MFSHLPKDLPDATLQDLARLGRVDLLAKKLEQGVDFKSVDALGFSPLMMASRHGQIESMQLLIKAGADVDEVMSNIFYKGYTPMMVAASNSHYAATALLLRSGADPMFENKEGESAWTMACMSSRFEVVQDCKDLMAAIRATEERSAIERAVPAAVELQARKPRI